MKSVSNNQDKYWAYFIGLLLPLAVILAPSYQTNLAEHMFTKSFVLQMLLGVSAVIYIFINRSKAIKYSIHPLAIVLYITFLLGLLSLFWSDNQGFTVVQLCKWLSGLILAFLVFQISDKNNQRIILQLFFLGAVLLAIIGIVQYLFGVDIVKQAAKPASTFANKNMAAQIAVLTWPLGIYLFVSSKLENQKEHYWRLFNAIGTSLLLVFIFYTQTQAAWLSVVGQSFLLVLIFIFTKVKKIKLLDFSSSHKNASIIAVLALILLSNLNNEGVKPFWEKTQQGADKVVTRAENTEGNQATVRFMLWQGAMDMAKKDPIKGVGVGSYYHNTQEFSNARTHTIRSAHNDYLQSIAELGYGIIVLILATWLLLGIMFFKLLWVNLAERFRDIILIVAVGGMAITTIFSFPLQLQTPILLIATYISLLLSSNNFKQMTTSSKNVLLVLSGATALLLIVLNLTWNSKLSEFNQKVRSNDWKQEINFDLGNFANHPMFKWFSQRVSREYMYSKPGSAFKVASSYLSLSPNDSVLINNKIYALIKLKRYQEAKELIQLVRQYEPEGYYRSYYNELILLTELKEFSQLEGALDILDKEDIGLLSMKPETLDNMSVAAYNLNQKERAIDYLKKNIEIHSSFVNSYKKIITMLNSTGDKEEAESYEKALKSLELN